MTMALIARAVRVKEEGKVNPRELLRRAREGGKSLLLEDEAKEVLEAAGIATTRCYRVKSAEEAKAVATGIGFPVVLKVCSPRIPHKSNVGGVALNLASEEEVAEAYTRLLAIGRRYDPQVALVVEKMAPSGPELIVGVTTDHRFGSVIMLGLGGIFAEVAEDASYRLLPVSEEEAWEMIVSLRSYPVLAGYRGREAVDLAAVQQVLLKISALATENKEIKELDLNPLVAYAHRALVLDARMLLN